MKPATLTFPNGLAIPVVIPSGTADPYPYTETYRIEITVACTAASREEAEAILAAARDARTPPQEIR